VIFRTKHTLRSSVMKTRPERWWQMAQMAQHVYSMPYECDRSYIDETGRPLTMQLHECRHNFKESLLEKSRLAQHAYEEGHRVM
jgi:hypothetical protein